MLRRIFVPLTVLFLAAVSCGGSSARDPGGDVGATLKDFSITLTRSSFAAGDITFGIANDGPSVHEFVILKTDADPASLPVESGVIPEDQVDLVDEAEDIAPSTTTTLSANLTAGSYVLVCNLPSHYAAGMHAAFKVG
jgi:uncharacterized cupredoxin-like copper-binding protein